MSTQRFGDLRISRCFSALCVCRHFGDLYVYILNFNWYWSVPYIFSCFASAIGRLSNSQSHGATSHTVDRWRNPYPVGMFIILHILSHAILQPVKFCDHCQTKSVSKIRKYCLCIFFPCIFCGASDAMLNKVPPAGRWHLLLTPPGGLFQRFPPLSQCTQCRCTPEQGFIQDFSTGRDPASVPLCSHPRYTRWGGGELCQYWLDWTSGERGPSHHALCTKYMLSKIGIDAWNPWLCDLLQERIQDFPSKVRSKHTALSENFEFYQSISCILVGS